MSRMIWLGTTAAALAAAAGGVMLSKSGLARDDAPVPDMLLARLGPGAVLEQHLATLLSRLRQADEAGDGLDDGDLRLIRARSAAQARAQSVSQVLSYDLDADLIVTRAEVERAARRNVGNEDRRNRAADRLIESFDGNGDDRITVAEAAANAEPLPAGGDLEAFREIDPDRNGRTTAAELRDAATRAFASVDRDSNGIVSSMEYEAAAARIRAASAATNAPACAMPPPSRDARVVAFGAYESDAIASVHIGGPDTDTHLMEVAIERGRQPLYLVLTSYESMVWRFTGEVGRIERVVVSSAETARRAPRTTVAGADAGMSRVAPSIDHSGGISASGVAGLPADRVTIAGGNCPRYFSDVRESEVARATLRRSLGRAADAVTATYSAKGVSLPSGVVTKAERNAAPPPPGFDPAVWEEARRFYPGGLASIDPGAVVARARVAPYQVLPSQMGLAQLVGSGAAVRTPVGFRIVRPIPHMPPGMGGAHSTTLIFARGVSVPPADPVHSCIVREDGGAPRGAACRP